jgi:hypothetical protein
LSAFPLADFEATLPTPWRIGRKPYFFSVEHIKRKIQNGTLTVVIQVEISSKEKSEKGVMR